MATSTKQLRVLALYPELMNIYADRGNLQYLEKRCKWRSIDFELQTATIGEDFDPEACDLLYIGGGQDRDQRLCAEDLVEHKRDLITNAVEAGATLLAVCGGYQLLGNSYEVGSDSVPGIGLVDLKTVQESSERLIGEVAIEVDLDGQSRRLVGFENHAGRTYLSSENDALGTVLSGYGNNSVDQTEGVHIGKIFGTYLHGPLLPKNVWFADYLIKSSLGVDTLLQLDDKLENEVHRLALARLDLKP